MIKQSSWLPHALLLTAGVLAGYVLLVRGPIRARMEKVSDRAEQLMELENSMSAYRAAHAGLQMRSAVPLPDLRKGLKAELPVGSVRLEEGAAFRLNADWAERRTRVVFKQCPLPDLQTWLVRVQQQETGWRLMALDIRAESSGGMASGELELAGLEPISAGEAL